MQLVEAESDRTSAFSVAPKIMPFSFQEELLREGMRARLQCVVSEGDAPITIEWLKDNAVIPSQLDIKIQQMDEFSSILNIGQVTPKHNGNYTCKARNSATTVEHSAVLNVNVPPKIIPFAFVDDQFYKGMRAHITCAVSQGDPPLNFRWLKDDRPIPTSLQDVATRQYDKYTSSLSIDSVSSVHTGNYTCVVSNRAVTVSHTAQLLVHVPPKIVPFTFQDGHLLEGMLVRVACVVSRGDLPLNISWFKDNKPMSEDFSISVHKLDDYSSVLSIDPVSKKHDGNYTCIAKNLAGSDSFVAPIIVNELPKWVIKPNNTKIPIGGSTVMPCVTTGFPKPTTIWYKVE
uniref:Ig-like domain-containing protein n=1 Tax=Strigamia maritima TaxID=126957 RepID=T1JE40_STRMM